MCNNYKCSLYCNKTMVRGALIVKNRHLHNIFTIILLLICLIIGLSYIKDRIKNNSYSETDSNSYDSLQPDSYDEDNYEIYYDLSFMSEETRELYNRYASLYHNSITSPLNLFYEDILAFKRDSNNALIVNYIENKTYYLSNTPYKQFIDYLSESMTEKMINSLTAETFVDTDGYVSVLEFDGPFYSNISSPYYLVFRNNDKQLIYACIVSEDNDSPPALKGGYLYVFINTSEGWRLDYISKGFFEN